MQDNPASAVTAAFDGVSLRVADWAFRFQVTPAEIEQLLVAVPTEPSKVALLRRLTLVAVPPGRKRDAALATMSRLENPETPRVASTTPVAINATGLAAEQVVGDYLWHQAVSTGMDMQLAAAHVDALISNAGRKTAPTVLSLLAPQIFLDLKLLADDQVEAARAELARQRASLRAAARAKLQMSHHALDAPETAAHLAVLYRELREYSGLSLSQMSEALDQSLSWQRQREMGQLLAPPHLEVMRRVLDIPRVQCVPQTLRDEVSTAFDEHERAYVAAQTNAALENLVKLRQRARTQRQQAGVVGRQKVIELSNDAQFTDLEVVRTHFEKRWPTELHVLLEQELAWRDKELDDDAADLVIRRRASHHKDLGYPTGRELRAAVKLATLLIKARQLAHVSVPELANFCGRDIDDIRRLQDGLFADPDTLATAAMAIEICDPSAPLKAALMTALNQMHEISGYERQDVSWHAVSPYAPQLSKSLRLAREDNGYTQKEAGERVGLNEDAVRERENGANLKKHGAVAKAKLLADSYELSDATKQRLDELFHAQMYWLYARRMAFVRASAQARGNRVDKQTSTVASLIYGKRETAHLNREQLARNSGINFQQMLRLETPKENYSPSDWEAAIRVCASFGHANKVAAPLPSGAKAEPRMSVRAVNSNGTVSSPEATEFAVSAGDINYFRSVLAAENEDLADIVRRLSTSHDQKAAATKERPKPGEVNVPEIGRSSSTQRVDTSPQVGDLPLPAPAPAPAPAATSSDDLSVATGALTLDAQRQAARVSLVHAMRGEALAPDTLLRAAQELIIEGQLHRGQAWPAASVLAGVFYVAPARMKNIYDFLAEKGVVVLRGKSWFIADEPNVALESPSETVAPESVDEKRETATALVLAAMAEKVVEPQALSLAIQDLITQGILAPKYPLPAVRMLAVRLHTSPEVIEAAYQLMSHSGLAKKAGRTTWMVPAELPLAQPAAPLSPVLPSSVVEEPVQQREVTAEQLWQQVGGLFRLRCELSSSAQALTDSDAAGVTELAGFDAQDVLRFVQGRGDQVPLETRHAMLARLGSLRGWPLDPKNPASIYAHLLGSHMSTRKPVPSPWQLIAPLRTAMPADIKRALGRQYPRLLRGESGGEELEALREYVTHGLIAAEFENSAVPQASGSSASRRGASKQRLARYAAQVVADRQGNRATTANGVGYTIAELIAEGELCGSLPSVGPLCERLGVKNQSSVRIAYGFLEAAGIVVKDSGYGYSVVQGPHPDALEKFVGQLRLADYPTDPTTRRTGGRKPVDSSGKSREEIKQEKSRIGVEQARIVAEHHARHENRTRVANGLGYTIAELIAEGTLLGALPGLRLLAQKMPPPQVENAEPCTESAVRETYNLLLAAGIIAKGSGAAYSVVQGPHPDAVEKFVEQLRLTDHPIDPTRTRKKPARAGSGREVLTSGTVRVAPAAKYEQDAPAMWRQIGILACAYFGCAAQPSEAQVAQVAQQVDMDPNELGQVFAGAGAENVATVNSLLMRVTAIARSSATYVDWIEPPDSGDDPYLIYGRLLWAYAIRHRITPQDFERTIRPKLEPSQRNDAAVLLSGLIRGENYPRFRDKVTRIVSQSKQRLVAMPECESWRLNPNDERVSALMRLFRLGGQHYKDGAHPWVDSGWPALSVDLMSRYGFEPASIDSMSSAYLRRLAAGGGYDSYSDLNDTLRLAHALFASEPRELARAKATVAKQEARLDGRTRAEIVRLDEHFPGWRGSLWPDVGVLLQKTRAKHRLSTDEIAENLGCSAEDVRRWGHGGGYRQRDAELIQEFFARWPASTTDWPVDEDNAAEVLKYQRSKALLAHTAGSNQSYLSYQRWLAQRPEELSPQWRAMVVSVFARRADIFASRESVEAQWGPLSTIKALEEGRVPKTDREWDAARGVVFAAGEGAQWAQASASVGGKKPEIERPEPATDDPWHTLMAWARDAGSQRLTSLRDGRYDEYQQLTTAAFAHFTKVENGKVQPGYETIDFAEKLAQGLRLMDPARAHIREVAQTLRSGLSSELAAALPENLSAEARQAVLAIHRDLVHKPEPALQAIMDLYQKSESTRNKCLSALKFRNPVGLPKALLPLLGAIYGWNDEISRQLPTISAAKMAKPGDSKTKPASDSCAVVSRRNAVTMTVRELGGARRAGARA
ncbi:MAG: hypothetical protein HOQ05_08535 [Corynebacteriales bacterium]|nr:hypothetical protein [Mycobacteriales bacterium]